MAREAPHGVSRGTAAQPCIRPPSIAALSIVQESLLHPGASDMHLPRAPWLCRVPPLTTLVKVRPRGKMLAFTSVFGAYWLAFPWMLEAWGMASRVFALSYIVLAALLWGLKGGMLIALVNMPIVWGLLTLLRVDYVGGPIGPLMTLSLAAIVGRLTDLSLALEAQYEQSRQAEQALQAYRQNLERVVQERTAHLARANQLLQREGDERQRIEAALRDSEEQYRQLVENINDVIYATDAEGVITYVSPAVEAQSGYTPAEIIGRVFADFVYREDRPHILQQFAHLLAGHLAPSTYRIVTKSGALRWIRSSSRPAVQGDRVVGVYGAYIDITEQRLLEEQLRQAHKMEAIGTLAGGIAHDFNNMLSAILGYTALALDALPPDSPPGHHLQQVLTAGERARGLVQQLLTFSHQTAPAPQPLQLHLLVQDALTLVRATVPTTIVLQSSLDTQAGAVLADPTQLHQVLLNLCTNAAHAMREAGGVLEIGLEACEVTAARAPYPAGLTPGPYLRLTVRDTGHGMTPDILERIFEPFFTTKGVGEGTGLGLAVVHGIITSHRGAITVTSTPGQGTTVVVYLPRVEAGAPHRAPHPGAPLPAGTERILFVDDEVPLADMGRAMLAGLGYEVVACASSLEALERFRAAPHSFALVISDQTMPVLTGEALARALRAIRPDVPIILCSGFSTTSAAEQALALGVNAFLMKPWQLGDLAQIIRQVLGTGAV
jgi:PAS domain S-box-containing protein